MHGAIRPISQYPSVEPDQGECFSSQRLLIIQYIFATHSIVLVKVAIRFNEIFIPI